MIWLIRHGETEWSRSGAHTGLSDIPLTANGQQQALALRDRLSGLQLSQVLTSPLVRARQTCQLAGFGGIARMEPNLVEWNYGEYEGRSTVDIRKERPGWYIFRDGVPGGETVEQVGERADLVIGRVLSVEGDSALFAHGHLLRILAARWLGLPAVEGKHLVLATAGIAVLSFEHGTRVIDRWNI